MLTMKDQLHHLSFVTPWNAVKLIFLLGVGLIFYKIIILKGKS